MIAPPFLPVPPATYGGTELFVAHLVQGLQACGHYVTLYANGESRVPCKLKWRYGHSDWPVTDPAAAELKNIDHAEWAMRDVARSTADVVHIQDCTALTYESEVGRPVVHTLHHPHEPVLSALYARHPKVHYVAISAAQARRESMRHLEVVHHGVPAADYTYRAVKRDFLAFLGRMAPCKGPHLAVAVARRAKLPLKLAGEIQPLFHEYWTEQVLPGVDGTQITYVGEADHARKNELLSNARALLFPIEWEEPFGLVMIEAMLCGTPVLALPGGSVREIIRDGVSGWVCGDVEEMAARAIEPRIDSAVCRAWAVERFSCERMVAGYLEVYRRAVGRTPDRPGRADTVNEGARPGAETSAS